MPPYCSSDSSVAWSGINAMLEVFTAIIQAVSQAVILAQALARQRDGFLLAGISMAMSAVSLSRRRYRRPYESPKSMPMILTRVIKI